MEKGVMSTIIIRNILSIIVVDGQQPFYPFFFWLCIFFLLDIYIYVYYIKYVKFTTQYHFHILFSIYIHMHCVYMSMMNIQSWRWMLVSPLFLFFSPHSFYLSFFFVFFFFFHSWITILDGLSFGMHTNISLGLLISGLQIYAISELRL